MSDPASVATSLVPAEAGGGVLGVSSPSGTELWAFGETAPGRAALENDRFGLSSITKGITALQVLMAGVPLHSPLAELLEEFVQPEVTALQVLSHTSGLSESANSAEDPARAALSAAEHLAIALSASLDFPPGSAFRYSSPGFWLLAEAIRCRTGLSHVDHLGSAVLAPLGLREIGYAPAAEPARYVLPRRGRVRGLHQEDTRRCAYPAGGISGTAGDLLALARAIPALVDLTELSPPRSAGEWLDHPARWATGWELGGPGTAWPTGSLYCSGGSGCAVWVDPARDVAACVLTAGWALPRDVIGQLGELLWGEL